MKPLTVIGQFLLICGIAYVNTACAEQSKSKAKAEASYANLCKIYEDEINNQRPRTADNLHKLVMRLNQEVPELHIENYQISRADPKDVYGLYKGAAEAAINKPWDCPAIKEYYHFSKNNNP